MVWKSCRQAASGCLMFFMFIINSVVGAVSAGDEWPSSSCQYPDWLRRRTWTSLNGQLQFDVDRGGTALHRKRSLTSPMTSETGTARGSEYRCRQLSDDGTSYERHSSATIQLSAFVLHDWSVVCHATCRSCARFSCAKKTDWLILYSNIIGIAQCSPSE